MQRRKRTARRRGLRGQAAVEYLILIGFVLAIIMPLFALFYYQSSGLTVSARASYASSIGQQIVDHAESVFYLGYPSQLQLRIQMPDGVNNVTVRNRELVFVIRGTSGTSDIVIPSRINMSGSVSPTPGIHVVTLQNRGSYVAINST